LHLKRSLLKNISQLLPIERLHLNRSLTSLRPMISLLQRSRQTLEQAKAELEQAAIQLEQERQHRRKLVKQLSCFDSELLQALGLDLDLLS